MHKYRYERITKWNDNNQEYLKSVEPRLGEGILYKIKKRKQKLWCGHVKNEDI